MDFENLKEWLSMGFNPKPRARTANLSRAIFALNKFYPLRYASDRIHLINPQLIYGHSHLTDMLQMHYSHKTMDDNSLVEGVVGFGHGRPIYFDMNDLVHLFITGQTGSGKTFGLFSILFSLMWLNLPNWLRVRMFATKDIGYFSEIAHVCMDKEGIREGAKSLTSSLRKRIKWLKDERFLTIERKNREGVTGRLMKHEIIVFDEFTNIIRMLKEEDRSSFLNDITQIASQGRALGMHLVIMAQRPDADSVPREVRTQLPSSLIFRQADEIDARIAGCPNATEYKRQQACLIYPKGKEYLQTPSMTEAQVEFFCKRIQVTLQKNGYEKCFK